MAGTRSSSRHRADRGDLAGAIRLLAKGFRMPREPQEHHLRRAYALGDLYERAGDVPQARSMFLRVLHVDPEYLDRGSAGSIARLTFAKLVPVS